MIHSTSKARAWLLSVALTALVPNAQAVVDCTGTVTNLSLRLDTVGTVTLSLSGGPSWVYLCDVDGAGRNGVSPTVCRSMYASLMAAYQTGKPVLIRFYDHAACDAIPSRPTPGRWAGRGWRGEAVADAPVRARTVARWRPPQPVAQTIDAHATQGVNP